MTGPGEYDAPLYALVHLPDTDPTPHDGRVVVMFPTPADAERYATARGLTGYLVAPVTFSVTERLRNPRPGL